MFGKRLAHQTNPIVEIKQPGIDSPPTDDYYGRNAKSPPTFGQQN